VLPFDEDTIVAIATPPGTGGLAVLRLSGPLALETVRRFFSRPDKITPRYAAYGALVHPDLGEDVFDDCIVTFFKGPHSVTGEDLVEISIHGGSFLQQKLLEVLLRAPGVRAASAGEYTLRSFLRGKIDLSRAEAVVDLIHAKDAAAHRNARHQLQGALRTLVQSMEQELLQVLVQIEAELDFSDQEINPTCLTDLLPALEALSAKNQRVLATWFYGRRLEEGFRVPLIGAPNSGKSSIFNRLLGEDRAIITPRPGTTRDTIEKNLMIGGHTVVLIDTAGLRNTPDPAERSGVDRSVDEMERADIVILVQAPDTPEATTPTLNNTPYISVYNKVDLDNNPLNNFDVYLSCVTGAGFETLKELIYSQVINMVTAGVQGVVVSNERHLDIFQRFGDQLAVCQQAIQSGLGPEYLASDLRQALDFLGEITGKTTPDDVLNQIFSGFCVGK